MATIQEYISDHLVQRLEDCHSLIVYDPEQRYREICYDIYEPGQPFPSLTFESLVSLLISGNMALIF